MRSGSVIIMNLGEGRVGANGADPPHTLFPVPWRRKLACLEQDRGILVIIAHLGVCRGGERNHAQPERCETFGFPAGFLGGLAADLLLSLQAFSSPLDVGLDDVDGLDSHLSFSSGAMGRLIGTPPAERGRKRRPARGGYR